MSEEFRRELSRRARLQRLKILGFNTATLTPTGATTTNPVFSTLQMKYQGPGVFIPDGFCASGFTTSNGNIAGPTPNNWDASIADQMGRIIIDKKGVYFTGNINTYYSNFDSGTGLLTNEFWQANINLYSATARVVCFAFVGTEFLF